MNSKKAHLCKKEVVFLQPKFCQHFTPLGDHLSSYIDTLKTENADHQWKHTDILRSPE